MLNNVIHRSRIDFLTGFETSVVFYSINYNVKIQLTAQQIQVIL